MCTASATSSMRTGSAQRHFARLTLTQQRFKRTLAPLPQRRLRPFGSLLIRTKWIVEVTLQVPGQFSPTQSDDWKSPLVARQLNLLGAIVVREWNTSA